MVPKLTSLSVLVAIGLLLLLLSITTVRVHQCMYVCMHECACVCALI